MNEPTFVTSARHVLKEHGVAIVGIEKGELRPECSWESVYNNDTGEEDFVIVGEGSESATLLDALTANMLVSVWDALNETNREKFAKLSFLKAISIGWSCVR